MLECANRRDEWWEEHKCRRSWRNNCSRYMKKGRRDEPWWTRDDSQLEGPLRGSLFGSGGKNQTRPFEYSWVGRSSNINQTRLIRPWAAQFSQFISLPFQGLLDRSWPWSSGELWERWWLHTSRVPHRQCLNGTMTPWVLRIEPSSKTPVQVYRELFVTPTSL